MNSGDISPLRLFSLAVDDMFRLAETTSVEEFPEVLLEMLHRHLVFDGAVAGHADPLAYGKFSIAVAKVHRRDASLLDEYESLSASDPVTGAFLKGLGQPLAVDTERVYAAPEHAGLLAYVRKHRLRHLLLFGYPPSMKLRGRWIVLYRADDRPFEPASSDWFGAFFHHVDRALDLNRCRALMRPPVSARRKGLALVDREGRISMADALFPALLEAEFRESHPLRLPAALLLAMRQAQLFQGRRVLGNFTPVGSHYVCELRDAGPLGLLSPREGDVARRFARGLSSREIALEIGVSSSTVHSHLASIYRKLGVSEKASLARMFADGDV